MYSHIYTYIYIYKGEITPLGAEELVYPSPGLKGLCAAFGTIIQKSKSVSTQRHTTHSLIHSLWITHTTCLIQHMISTLSHLRYLYIYQVSMSNWAARPLTERQQVYASQDAYASLWTVLQLHRGNHLKNANNYVNLGMYKLLGLLPVNGNSSTGLLR